MVHQKKKKYWKGYPESTRRRRRRQQGRWEWGWAEPESKVKKHHRDPAHQLCQEGSRAGPAETDQLLLWVSQTDHLEELTRATWKTLSHWPPSQSFEFHPTPFFLIAQKGGMCRHGLDLSVSEDDQGKMLGSFWKTSVWRCSSNTGFYCSLELSQSLSGITN